MVVGFRLRDSTTPCLQKNFIENTPSESGRFTVRVAQRAEMNKITKSNVKASKNGKTPCWYLLEGLYRHLTDETILAAC